MLGGAVARQLAVDLRPAAAPARGQTGKNGVRQYLLTKLVMRKSRHFTCAIARGQTREESGPRSGQKRGTRPKWSNL